MYTSSTFVLTAILALTRVAIATPPACLLAVVGIYPDPSDTDRLCGTLQEAVVGNLTEKCSGDALKSAYSIYSSTCLSIESVTITATTSAPSSTGTGSATTTSSGSRATGSSSPSGSSRITSGGASSTQSGAGSSATGNSAGSNSPQIALAVLAASFVGQYLL